MLQECLPVCTLYPLRGHVHVFRSEETALLLNIKVFAVFWKNDANTGLHLVVAGHDV